jgi:competence protein ComFA
MIEQIVKNYTSESVKAIVNNKCNRCQGDHIEKDSLGISYCLDCYVYSEINSLMYLSRNARRIIKTEHQMNLKFSLTNEQIIASRFLLQCFKNRKDAFLHAVCGAGKTEIILSLIFYLLVNNQRIAFVIPRVEIIKQVGIRLKNYFPKTRILTLHGENSIIDQSPLIVLTPQQLIKFYQEFDLIILDEVDAFPFVNNPFLERLVYKAMKEKAQLIFMSATITRKYQLLIKEHKLEYHLLAKRYHQRDLVIPKFEKIKSYKDKKVISIINRLKKKQQLIIFVASINKGEVFSKYLQNNSLSCELISSKTKYKPEVIKAFINGENNILISTTILERGVTFKNISVLVLEASDKIFTKSTLIQIAGRVGRVDISGEVIFLADFITNDMLDARKEIIMMNKRKDEM